MGLEERSAATRRRQDDGRALFVMGRRQSYHEEIALYSLSRVPDRSGQGDEIKAENGIEEG